MSDKPKQNTKPEPRNKKEKGIKAERSLDKQMNLEEVALEEQGGNKWNKQAFIWLGALTLVAAVTRLYGLNQPNVVVSDEVSNGKYISDYLKREYFFDFQPPLGKLFFAAIGKVLGYNGSFDFEKVGLSYQNTQVPYVALRSFSALCGTSVVAIVYALLIEMQFALPIAVLGSCLVVFDNALITQSRFILLDSQLILFVVASCFCWVKFRSQTRNPFTSQWWAWLLATGVLVGLSMGVKLIGISIILAVGACAIVDLWDVMDIKKTPKDIIVALHWAARAVCLLGIPIAIVLASYWMHFEVANHTGRGDDYMSNQFQATLKGSNVTLGTHTVYYGSFIKLMNKAERIYLNSHNHTYPLKHSDGKVSSQGQQVTGAGTADDNNDWLILPPFVDPPIDYMKDPKIPIKDGDIVRLLHAETEKYLMTHDVASPLTLTNQEVTAVEAFEKSDEKYENTLWRVDIVSGGNTLKGKVVVFKLHNVPSKTNLLNLQENLPSWGFKHREINSGRVDDKRAWWFVDDILVQEEEGGENKTSTDENRVKKEEKDDAVLSFWDKISELAGVSIENGHKVGTKSSNLTSPLSWPFNTRGTKFWISKDKTQRVHLLGNPFAWLIASASLIIFVAVLLIDQLLQLHGSTFLTQEQKRFMYPRGLFFLSGYLLHYLPFVVMEGKVAFSHYLPCYLFNTLIFATLYQTLALKFEIINKPAVVGLICSLIAGSFLHFSSLVYGTAHNQEYFEGHRWISSWHF